MMYRLRNIMLVTSLKNIILVVLFDALTEFLKKQALKGANEIIGYYSKKYKTVHHHSTGQKGAHVVGHYADVARLVGLTENELYTQLKELKRHANLSKLNINGAREQLLILI